MELLYGCPVRQVGSTVGVVCAPQSGKQRVFLPGRLRDPGPSRLLIPCPTTASVHNGITVNLRQVTLRRLLCPKINMNQDDDGEAAQAEARVVASGGEGTQSRDGMPMAEPPKSGVDALVAGEPRPPVGEERE